MTGGERAGLGGLPETIPAVVERAARVWAGAEALVEGTLRLTFAELAEAVDIAARGLRAYGVAPGDRVAIWAPNSARWVIAALAVQRIGAVLVTVNTRFKADEAAHVLRVSRATVLVTVTDFLGTDYVALLGVRDDLPKLQGIIVLDGPTRPGTTGWDALVDMAATTDTETVAALAAAVTGDTIADIVFTSGTTGAPKGAMLSHGASVRAFDAWSTVVGLQPGDRHLIVNPFFHCFGLKAGILACLIKGATILPHAVFDVPAVLQRVHDERITVLPGPPAIYQSMLDQATEPGLDLTSLRIAVTGGASVPVELIRRMRDELTFTNVITGYGLTEATGIVTMCRHGDDPTVIATTAGRPIDDVEVLVVDDAGHPQPIDEPGEILVRGYNVMPGYFDDADATAEAIGGDGWLRTGDIGVIDSRGNLRITDRKKDMFISGGFNAYPAEIENTLSGHPGVAQVAVVGVPDHRMGEVGMAFVVRRPDQVLDEDTLLAWGRERLANYKVPRSVQFVDALPFNAGGKVVKNTLRARGRDIVENHR